MQFLIVFEENVLGIWSFEFGGLRWRRDFLASTPWNGESTRGNLYEQATANIFEFCLWPNNSIRSQSPQSLISHESQGALGDLL